MTKKLAIGAVVSAALGIAILFAVHPGIASPEGIRRYRAEEHQKLVGLDRGEVESELALSSDPGWTSLDTFFHGTINQLDLPGMSVVCYGEWVVSVEPNQR